MKNTDYREFIVSAVDKHRSGDSADLDLLAAHMNLCDKAKQELRKKGYGVTGTPILQTAQQVPDASE